MEDRCKEEQLYFAYGSNLNPDQMKERCPDSSFVSLAFFPNHRLAFNKTSQRWGGAVADAVFKQGKIVWGVVYWVSDSDMGNLDRFEGTHLASGYIRHKVTVRTEEGASLHAWAYFVKIKQKEQKPSRAYLAAILKGARHHGLPRAYVRTLERVETISGQTT